MSRYEYAYRILTVHNLLFSCLADSCTTLVVVVVVIVVIVVAGAIAYPIHAHIG